MVPDIITPRPLAFVGIGAQILPQICVGESSFVAAGATVIKHVEAKTLVAGCPAVLKKERNSGMQL